MEWSWFPLTCVYLGTAFCGVTFFGFFVFQFFKQKDDNSCSDDSIVKSAIKRCFKLWSCKAIFLCLVLLLACQIAGDFLVVHYVETKGYKVIIEDEFANGMFGSPQDIEIQFENTKALKSQFDIGNCCVNHENKLIFLMHGGKYDTDRPPEALSDIRFLNEK